MTAAMPVLAGIEDARARLMDALPMILSCDRLELVLVAVMEDGAHQTSYWYRGQTPRLEAQVALALRSASGGVIACNLTRNLMFQSAEVHTFCPMTGIAETYVFVQDRQTDDVLHLVESAEPTQESLHQWARECVPLH
jgi:hypothetical protein